MEPTWTPQGVNLDALGANLGPRKTALRTQSCKRVSPIDFWTPPYPPELNRGNEFARLTSGRHALGDPKISLGLPRNLPEPPLMFPKPPQILDINLTSFFAHPSSTFCKKQCFHVRRMRFVTEQSEDVSSESITFANVYRNGVQKMRLGANLDALGLSGVTPATPGHSQSLP